MSAELNLPARGPRVSMGRFVKAHMREYGMLLSLVAIVLFFQYMTDGTLLQPLNLTNLVLQNSYIVIMALGMLLVIVAGHIDLSVGSVVALIGALAATLMVRLHLDFVTTTLLCLLAGAAIGAVQGFWVAYLRIPSFIVTLAGMLVFRGLCLILLAGQSVGPFPVEFQRLSSGFIPDFLALDALNLGKFHLTSLLLCAAVAAALVAMNTRARLRRQSVAIEQEPLPLFVAKNVALAAVLIYVGQLMASYRGLPNVLIIMSVLIALYSFVTRNTTVGRRVYALGGNEKAAKLSGIDTRRLSFYTFVNMGVLAALAGLIFAARLNTATPKAGVSFELDVIAACFIGGASASGGVGRVTGAVIGAFIMGVMNNGMSILGIGIDWQQVIKGMVLLAAVTIDVYNKNKA
ncbi:sugar ABC transporter permease [Azospirillum brasilense]|uniref:Xylose transport system permease protein XylH n=1 Tax=Azospirillum brasilense TaxID=192 RepID=A0A0P0ET20_AZOBR|nr:MULTISPECIES: multiple monosaccharide ABC transporter permease [Azospirillum]ALJ39202.1 ABC transporter permease [Azospirillum brasilense]MDW7556234.1 multiple monosaccharide ABC transporter permease [Azospirillum brasilense]MDW7595638.1 multiple monosaccharide ABC transporter permease [Azospirillum brasilense]MDW7630643.1 multiple monosaccharide ABC transporter permease [Azospirillum brasilense]MDX5950374.1 multiple monosaccharide ABC transporter permease [Azospirillum brasilense]